MPPWINQANLDHLEEQRASVPQRAQNLIEGFILRAYISDVGEEYAHHGVARRIGTLARCIDQVFRLLPPEFGDVPDKEVREVVTIHTQAFVFNAFGVLDNLAFVWINERGVVGTNGRPLPNGRIGLTRDKERVWQSLPPAVKACLEEMEEWFGNLESFRHSLGHRIPLYIPPYSVDPRNAERFQTLRERMNEALSQFDMARYEQLEAERDSLRFFRPFMKHSLTDPAPPIVFHPQILADFATVEAISQRVLDALNAAPG